MPNARVAGFLLGAFGVILFSTKAILVKLAYKYGVGALHLLLFRMLFSVPVYIGILVWITHKKGFKVSKRELLAVAVAGFLGFYLASYFDFLGLKYIKAGLERVILFVFPTIVLLLSWLFLKEKITKVQIRAIAITYLGIIFAFWPELELSGRSVLIGGGLVLLSAITYATYIVGSGWLLPKLGVLRFTSLAMIFSTLCFLIQSLFSELSGLWGYQPEVYNYSVAMAFFATLIPSFLVSASIKKIGPSNFSILSSLGPISTIILAHFFLGENLLWQQLLAIGIVILGVVYLGLAKSKK